MARLYLRVLLCRAVRQAWSAVIAHSWQALVTKLASTGLLLALAYAYVRRTTSGADDQLFSDQLTIAGLAAAVAAILVFGVFLVQLLFVAPYQLWREEKERADAAQAAVAPVTRADRAARFHEALEALKRIANARELWWAAHRRKQGPSPLGDRPLEIINQIRQFFPAEVPGNYKDDQISRLWNATMSYGRTLGYEHGETEQLKTCRETFERELQGTIKLFEELNGAPSTGYEQLYQDELAKERTMLAAKERAEAEVEQRRAVRKLGLGGIGGMSQYFEDAMERDRLDRIAREAKERRERYGPSESE